MDDELDSWRLCEALSPIEAAALIAGVLPKKVRVNGYLSEVDSFTLPHGTAQQASQFEAALRAIVAALNRGSLQGDVSIYDPDTSSLENFRIAVDDLKAWLATRGNQTGFFFPEPEQDQPDYLDPSHTYYAPKLAAAVRAWEAVSSDPRRLRSTTPKKAIQQWLRENASAYGLKKRNGMTSEQAIEEISKLANWQPQGGASRTPGD